MALLEPCLPIWLMDTIKPTVIFNCLRIYSTGIYKIEKKIEIESNVCKSL